jgi:hypothetical protein
MSFAETHRYGGAFPSLERIFLIASGERPSLSATSPIVRSLPPRTSSISGSVQGWYFPAASASAAPLTALTNFRPSFLIRLHPRCAHWTFS